MHEVNQAARCRHCNGDALLRWLGNETPSLEEAPWRGEAHDQVDDNLK